MRSAAIIPFMVSFTVRFFKTIVAYICPKTKKPGRITAPRPRHCRIHASSKLFRSESFFFLLTLRRITLWCRICCLQRIPNYEPWGHLRIYCAETGGKVPESVKPFDENGSIACTAKVSPFSSCMGIHERLVFIRLTYEFALYLLMRQVSSFLQSRMTWWY